MPKLKQPATLEKLAVQALGRAVGQRAVEAIASGRDINTSALQDYLYGELPDVLSQEVTAHMLTNVSRTLIKEDYRKTDVSDTTKRVLLAIVCHSSRVIDLRNTPMYAVKTLAYNIQTFQKLHTFILANYLVKADFTETLAAGLRSLKFLVNFEMSFNCTDAIIQTLASCCCATLQQVVVSFSIRVTDASLKSLLDCRELKHLLIYYTSVTAEGFFQFLQHRKHDDSAKGLLGFSVGSWNGWDDSSTYLNEIALCCPMLKRLQICGLRLDMEALVSLTKLEALTVQDGQFDECNLDAFLRVRGCNITSLTLFRMDSIDLACILNHCVNIRRLSVTSGSMCTMGILETATNPCQYLESLELWCAFSPSSIEGMLYACVNLTSLDLHPSVEHITDQFLLRVLSKNPLQKLTRFTAFCNELTMRAVDAIIELCPLLEELKCFRCDRMTEAEVKILRQKIENGNLDLKIGFFASHFPW